MIASLNTEGTAGYLARVLECEFSRLRHLADHMINDRDGGCGSYTEILGFGYAALCVQVPGKEHRFFSVESNEQLSGEFQEFCKECKAALG